MITATKKHVAVVQGLTKFAMVTVGRNQGGDSRAITEPRIVLNGSASTTLSLEDQLVIEAARRGIGEAEAESDWQGPVHFVVEIEGLIVDGIDADAAYRAARKATQELIGA